METQFQDLRHAIRKLRKSPGFTLLSSTGVLIGLAGSFGATPLLSNFLFYGVKPTTQ